MEVFHGIRMAETKLNLLFMRTPEGDQIQGNSVPREIMRSVFRAGLRDASQGRSKSRRDHPRLGAQHVQRVRKATRQMARLVPQWSPLVLERPLAVQDGTA